MIGTKVLSRNEFNKSGIDTNAFEFNYEPGKFEASIVLMAQGHYGILRVFLEFDDGRKIIAPVWGWQDYLGFYDRKPGDRVCLIYEQVGEKDRKSVV